MPTHDRRRYGPAHQKHRTKWQPVVDRGDARCHAVICLEDDRTLTPGAPWDMGHTPDGEQWTGPEHPRCNRSEGAARGNGRRTMPASQDW